MSQDCYLITRVRDGALDVFSINRDGVQTILIFECLDDAERYVIMLQEDVEYIVGDELELEVTEIPLGDAIDIFNKKGHNYIFVKEDDLFVPPDTDFFPPPAADY